MVFLKIRLFNYQKLPFFTSENKMYKLLWKLNWHHSGKKTISFKRKRQTLYLPQVGDTPSEDMIQYRTHTTPMSNHSPCSSVESCIKQELYMFFVHLFVWFCHGYFVQLWEKYSNLFKGCKIHRDSSGEYLSYSIKEEPVLIILCKIKERYRIVKSNRLYLKL